MNTDLQNREALALHLRKATAAATLLTQPGSHMVIADLLPADVYTQLLDAMPPRSLRGRRPQSERYAYQFYVGPTKSKVARLVRRLPPEQAVVWSDLSDPDRGY